MRKHYMSAACHDGDFVAQGFSNTTSYDDRRENELRVHCCKQVAGKTDGWMEMTVYKNTEKRTLQQSICLNRQQAIALRDLLNAAFGGSSRVARTIQGSILNGIHALAIVEDQ